MGAGGFMNVAMLAAAWPLTPLRRAWPVKPTIRCGGPGDCHARYGNSKPLRHRWRDTRLDVPPRSQRVV